MINWIKHNWHKTIFPLCFIIFILNMFAEYYRGNCNIGKFPEIKLTIDLPQIEPYKIYFCQHSYFK